MNTHVNFEIAKLLKEKGFKQSFGNGENFYYPLTKEITENHRGNNYPAPLISDVVMWLHVKHEIWISVTPFKKEDSTTVYIYTIFKNDYVDTVSRASTGCITINLAYEAAIEYCLKNLI